MASQIVIKKTYFDNIKVAIDAMNKFFSSNFKTKAFPVVNNDFQLDRIIARTLSWLNNVEPSWVDDPNQAAKTLQGLKELLDGEGSVQGIQEGTDPNLDPGTQGVSDDRWTMLMNGDNQSAKDHYHAFAGFKVLQFITDHFDQFEELLNGIYSFELFTKPSQFRDAITLFTSPIPMTELDEIVKAPGDYKLFDAADYVNSIFENDQIKLPEDMVADTEINRFRSFTDLDGVEIVIDETVQEAAEVDYFTDTKPSHIKYDSKARKWKISKQFEKEIDSLISDLRKCDATEDLVEMFSSKKRNVDIFTSSVIPAILCRVFNNVKKYPFDTYDVDQCGAYTKSYRSIIDKNAGAKRFANYDLFSTFKVDKEGTIQFLEDFLKLNLVNNPSTAISNNTLLTLFNIFDSRIYLDILYNLIPEEARDGDSDIPDKDGFVKQIRSRINKNSKNANPYQKSKKSDNTIETTEEVTESVYDTLKELGDLTISEMQYCEAFAEAVYDDINTIGDSLYNKGVSSIMIDRYIGESHNLFQEGFFDRFKKPEKTIDDIISDFEKEFGKVHESLVEFYKTTDDPWKQYTGSRYGGKHPGVVNQMYKAKDVFCRLTGWTLKETGMILIADFIDDKAIFGDEEEGYTSIDMCPGIYVDNTSGTVYFSRNSECSADEIKGDRIQLAKNISEFIQKLKPKTVQEASAAEMGDIPTYMKDRINLSDGDPEKEPVTVTDVQLPPDIPTNDIDDLADSINTRLDAEGDSLGDFLGAGYKGDVKPPQQGGHGTVIYNITNNNYHNSHNTTTTTTNDLSSNKQTTTSNDLSSGKTTTNTSTNSNVSNDLSSNKQTTNSQRTHTSTNNYDNTSTPTDTKESPNTFSNGRSVQEVFALLDSEEPLFVEADAGKPPKGDVLTTAMDVDRETLSLQQKAKRGVQKVVNTGRAIAKPVTRTRSWLTKMVNSVIKRDEDKVKADIVENKSYRNGLYKVCRIALKTGKFALFSAVSPWLGAAYLGKQVLDVADRQRLRKEVNSEIATEIQIIDEKIDHLKSAGRYGESNPETQKEIYQLMRMRQKLVDMSSDAHKQKLASRRSVY